MNMTTYLEKRYERECGEPWSALEASVRSRHPELFAMLDVYEDQEDGDTNKRPWWRFW